MGIYEAFYWVLVSELFVIGVIFTIARWGYLISEIYDAYSMEGERDLNPNWCKGCNPDNCVGCSNTEEDKLDNKDNGVYIGLHKYKGDKDV